MIGIEFKGRMGNQLFQYCFMLYLKKQNPKRTYFFSNPHHATFQKYFNLGARNNLLLNSKVYSLITRVIPKICRFKDVFYFNFSKPRDVSPTPWTMHYGYWQTDYYLKQLEKNQLPKLKPSYIQAFQDAFGQYFNVPDKKTISVHIRLTDYKNHYKRDVSLPMSYFEQQLSSIEHLHNYTVFFVSDDIESVRSHFGERDNFIYSSNSEIIDFQIIMNTDIAIISNSTFSWWAAYLNEKQQRVIAPKNFLGFRIGREFPAGIMTSKFEWKEV